MRKFGGIVRLDSALGVLIAALLSLISESTLAATCDSTIYQEGATAETVVTERLDVVPYHIPWAGEIIDTTCIVKLNADGTSERRVVERIRIGVQPITLEHFAHGSRAYLYPETLDVVAADRKTDHTFIYCLNVGGARYCHLQLDPYSMMAISRSTSDGDYVRINMPRDELMTAFGAVGLAVAKPAGIQLPDGTFMVLHNNDNKFGYDVPTSEGIRIRENLTSTDPGAVFKFDVPVKMADGSVRYVKSQVSPQIIVFGMQLSEQLMTTLSERREKSPD